MTDMTDLIARLEAASEGSRELDAEIRARLSGRERLGPNFLDRSWMGIFDYDAQMGGLPEDKAVPRYTTSLDAALTLVPTGWVWQVRDVIQAQAIVWTLEKDWDERQPPTGYSAWPALALCIAALKARSAA